MAQLAVNEMTTYRWSFEMDVQQYAEAGIPAIGVWRQKLSDYGEEKGADLLAEARLQVSSLSWAGGFTGSDGRTHAESIDDARDAVRLAAALRAGCLIIHSGARAGHTHNHARRLFRSALDKLLPLAEELRVPLAIEPMHAASGCDWTFLTDLGEAAQLVASFESPHVRLAFDTYQWGHEPDLPGRVAQLAPLTGIVQLGDSKGPPQAEQNRCLLGAGDVPLGEILAAFRAGGYAGFFEVELMGEDIEATNYRELLAVSQERFRAWNGYAA